ncbi:hypothetical protein KSW81_006393 [Nannochloris sp. 'desiccata']|nr:hypothetical protein KSW81_006393 [Chlorella desiccata (nom. nud.)]
MSPLVDALLRLYPPGTITLQAGTLEEDVAVVLGARHLVASQGTFAYALALASPNLETLYMFNNIVHALDERAFWCDVNKVYSYAPNAGEYIGRRSAAQLSTTALMREKTPTKAGDIWICIWRCIYNFSRECFTGTRKDYGHKRHSCHCLQILITVVWNMKVCYLYYVNYA